MSLSPLLTEADLCERWSCSLRTIARYRSQGLVAVKIGVGVKFRQSDVEEFEASKATAPPKKKRRPREERLPELPVFKHLTIKP